MDFVSCICVFVNLSNVCMLFCTNGLSIFARHNNFQVHFFFKSFINLDCDMIKIIPVNKFLYQLFELTHGIC